MKLVNHKEKNRYNLEDGTSIKGTIYMSQKEWTKSYLWLRSQYQKAIKDIETYKRDSLSSLKKDKGLLFSIGVLATSLLAKKYQLKGYKDQNYGIKIV